MFANATTIAVGFTRPIVISRRESSGKCFSAIGSYVVVNDEGWFVTACHIVQMLQQLADAVKAFQDHGVRRVQIERDQTLTDKARRKALALHGTPKSDSITNYSVWWGADELKVMDLFGWPDCEIAAGRLEPFDPVFVGGYPIFKDPTKGFSPGTSVCKLGFPFHDIEPIWAGGNFQLPPDKVPPPFFPIEGIVTRNISFGRTPSGHSKGWLETSSPGLRGQSGGPIYDQHGTVWGIQSQTAHLPLGFNPPVPGNKKGLVEHQFLNVGMGVHPETLVAFLTDRGIKHQVSAY